MVPAPNSIPSYRLYRERTGETGDFWLHCETIPERTLPHNYEITPHRHEALFQIFLITSGAGEMTLEGEAGAFDAPCALLVPHNTVHGFHYERGIDGLVITALADRLLSVAASDRRIAEFAAAPRIVPLRTDAGAAAARTLEAIAHELANPAPGRLVLLESLMTQAIIALFRVHLEHHPRDDRIDGRNSRRLDDLAALIGVHFREHRPVGFYAERLGITPTHLNRIARTETGQTVQGLIARRVIEAARRDLVFSATPIQNIAYSLGFADPAYFNRYFRREVGATPGEFRENERRRLAL